MYIYLYNVHKYVYYIYVSSFIYILVSYSHTKLCNNKSGESDFSVLLLLFKHIHTFYSSNHRRTTNGGHTFSVNVNERVWAYTCVYCSKIVFKITIIVVNVDFNMYKRNKDVFLKTWLLFAMQAIMRLMCIKICNSYTHTCVYIFVFLLIICKLYRERNSNNSNNNHVWITCKS